MAATTSAAADPGLTDHAGLCIAPTSINLCRKRAVSRLSFGPRRYIREERAQPLRYGEMGDDGVAQLRIRQVSEHRHLNRGHDLTRFGADHREAQDTIVAGADDRLH